MVKAIALKHWWQDRPRREQIIIHAGIGLLALIIFLICCWLPWLKQTSELRQQVQQSAQLANWLAQNKVVISQLRGTVPVSKNSNQLLNKLLTKFKFLPQHVHQQTLAAGKIQLNFHQIGFDQFITWLEQLNNAGLFQLTYLKILSSSTSGYVDAELQLQPNSE